MNSSSRVYACVGIACTAGILLAAQQPPPQQQRPPVFRGESVLVTVDTYPHRDGRIIEGLTAADFQVFEDGKPQSVESIEFVRIEPSLSEATRRDPNTVKEMIEEASNPRNRVFVVFLDQLHVTVGGAHAIRQPLVDSLNRIIGPDDLFGLMTQNTDPRALTFGRRLLSIETALAQYWDWGERYRLGLDVTDPMEEWLKACYQYKPGTLQDPLPPWRVFDNGQRRYLYELLVDRRREDRTLTALERLIERLIGLREARTVALVLTDGWRLFPRDADLERELSVYGPVLPGVGSQGGRLTPAKGRAAEHYVYLQECQAELARLAQLENDRRLRTIISRANQANVSFYPVRPSGLATFDTPNSQRSQPSLAEDGNRLRNRENAMLTLAESTDGLAIVHTNDLAAGMGRIVDDVSAYYLLGYYSTNTAHDGRYRRIEVKVKTPDVRVRARRGYFAPSDRTSGNRGVTPQPSAPAAPAGLGEALGALSRLRTSAEVFIRGHVAGSEARVTVEVASARSTGAPWNAGAEVSVAFTSLDGGPAPAPVTARIEPNTRGVLLTIPIGAAKPPFRVTARVSAGGEGLEEFAEITAADGPLAGEAVLYRGRPAGSSPLRAVADLQYRRTERVRAEWVVSGELDARSARLLGRGGQPVPVPVNLTEREADGRRLLAADLNLAPLTAGDYLIEVTIGRGGLTEVKLVAFRVIP